jgi:hypothetical protein
MAKGHYGSIGLCVQWRTTAPFSRGSVPVRAGSLATEMRGGLFDGDSGGDGGQIYAEADADIGETEQDIVRAFGDLASVCQLRKCI